MGPSKVKFHSDIRPTQFQAIYWSRISEQLEPSIHSTPAKGKWLTVSRTWKKKKLSAMYSTKYFDGVFGHRTFSRRDSKSGDESTPLVTAVESPKHQEPIRNIMLSTPLGERYKSNPTTLLSQPECSPNIERLPRLESCPNNRRGFCTRSGTFCFRRAAATG
ncbi:hypothetical protein PAAG_00069 [Paracoccidioides lutzii Pb01]|uniref:Uncharacterized protein n=1 Tax=Paracoccidioides lutzii (strain ATCC MYA-826 / Pb01) TaxID=502779 RepID=C1GNH4_PARBA|nr:hypothetical protein PAAG_00069 [Paracoccidioides lutzii Pb01]EEH35746.2 hypothetical protein PAAG_00069 [Paracoccidioides lutzii Pb01]